MKKHLKSFFRVAVLASVTLLLSGKFVFASTGTGGPGSGSGGTGGPGGTGGNIGFNISNPFSGGSTLYAFIETVISDILMPIGGVIVVIFIIYSGFKFVTAQGNESKLKEARQGFMYVVIGSAVLLGAWVIAQVIQSTITALQVP